MKVVVAIDSFKGSLTSVEAGEAVKKGIENVYSDAQVIVKPLADGGEGTVDALVQGLDGRYEYIDVTGPVGRKVKSKYGIVEDKLAIIEMSEAAGITLVDESERNPYYTTTYGVGEIIKDAIKKGCREFIVGIGGSATNDGGLGMLQALGYSISDKNGKDILFGAIGMKEIHSITDEKVIPELKDCTFKIACDVNNPLYGENGASHIYGPQKGATPEMVKDMDTWMRQYEKVSKIYNKNADASEPGTGAAGGMGFAFRTFMDSSLESGIKIILNKTAIEEDIKDSDIVITGEGKLDAQTAMGKAPIGVTDIAGKYNKKVIAFSGAIGDGTEILNEKGIDAYFPIIRRIESLDKAMEKENAKSNMEKTSEQVFRLIKTFE